MPINKIHAYQKYYETGNQDAYKKSHVEVNSWFRKIGSEGKKWSKKS